MNLNSPQSMNNISEPRAHSLSLSSNHNSNSASNIPEEQQNPMYELEDEIDTRGSEKSFSTELIIAHSNFENGHPLIQKDDRSFKSLLTKRCRYQMINEPSANQSKSDISTYLFSWTYQVRLSMMSNILQNSKFEYKMTQSGENLDFQSSQHTQSEVSKISVFNSLTRLFFNSLITCFTKMNFDLLNIPEILQEKVLETIDLIQSSGKKLIQNSTSKTDLFGHQHYNLLFLQLTISNMRVLGQKQKDFELHQYCFGIDLETCTNHDQISLINLIKQTMYTVVQFALKNEKKQQNDDSWSVLDQFQRRALFGIRQLADGYITQRF